MEERVKVVNLVSSRVNIDLPEVRLKRIWEKKGAVKTIPFEQLEEAMYNPGVEALFREGMLGIEDLEIKKKLGLEPEDATEPVNIITLDDTQRKRYLTVMPLHEFKEEIKKLPIEQINELAAYAIEHEILDYDKLWKYDNVFANLVNNPEVSFNHSSWHKRVINEIDSETGYHKMIDEYSSPTPSLLIDEEGDEDYILECIEDYKTLDDKATIDNIHEYFKHNTLTVNPWEYIPLEVLYIDESACANVCANMGNPDDYVVNIKRDYAEVTNIKDNFTQSMSYEEFMKGVQNNG